MQNKIIYVTPTSFTTCLLDDTACRDYFEGFGVEMQNNNRPHNSSWVAYVEECKKEKLRQRLFGKGK